MGTYGSGAATGAGATAHHLLLIQQVHKMVQYALNAVAVGLTNTTSVPFVRPTVTSAPLVQEVLRKKDFPLSASGLYVVRFFIVMVDTHSGSSTQNAVA